MAESETSIDSRAFAAGRANFLVACPNIAVRDCVEALFVDLPPPSSSGDPTRITLESNRDGTMSLTLEGGNTFASQPPGLVLARLVTTVSRLSLDADPSSLHLHCAALSLNGIGLLISAESGTGKTTLAAVLARRGWAYISDEAAAFAKDRDNGSGFAKPLSIKPGGGDLMPELEVAKVSFGVNEEGWWQVPASALPAQTKNELHPGLIVILRRTPDGSTNNPPMPAPMHPADAVVELMGQTMDAERYGKGSVEVLARLAAAASCVGLYVGPLEATAEALEALIEVPIETYAVRVLESTSEPVAARRVPANVRSVVIGDRAVIHDTEGGSIVALDEAGTSVWLALHNEPAPWWQDEAWLDPGIVGFLEQLESHRLVSSVPDQKSNGAA